MLSAIRSFLEKTNNIERSTYIWNSINAIVAACQCPVILMVITRTNSVYDAGVFSIAFAVASLMLYIGLYGLRKFQASDINEKYSFSEYHGMRIITCTVMFVVCLCYCIYSVLFKDYNTDKFIVVLMVCMIRCVQAYTDVMHGRMQQKGRLDVAAKVSAIRYFSEVLVYVAMLVLTHDLVISSIVCVFVSIIVMMLTTVNVAKNYCKIEFSIEIWKIKRLFIDGFPIFASLFLNMYVSNAPKYAIDTYLTEEVQAVYNLIFMPAFMVGLLANFIFNPILTSYAKVWIKREIKHFEKLIKKQSAVIAGITAVGLIVAATIGIPILSWIFNVDLSMYRVELCVVMIGGGMLAYSTFFSTVITIIRMQYTLIISYGTVALIAKLFSKFFVINYGILGATALYGVLMTLLSIMLMVIMVYKIRKEKVHLYQGE